MKKIFIYYSLTGNGDIIANYFKNKNIDIRKVVTKEPLPKNFILSIITGGFKASINYCDKLDNFDNNIDNYDEIIIGSPIWNNRLSCPINSVFKELDLNNKKVIFILYSGSGKGLKAEEKIKKLYNNAKVIHIKDAKNNKDIDNLLGGI